MPGALEEAAVDHVTVFASTRLDAPQQLATELDCREWTESALVARAYLKWGDRFPEHLAGDFAVLVWDRHERRLIASRDPFGVKSLFYRRAPGGIWLSRDQARLLGTFDGVPALDDDRIVEHLLGVFSATDRTFFSAVRAVPPGHSIVFRRDRTEARAYWTPPSSAPDRTASYPTTAFLEEFRRLFRQSVATRVRGCTSALIHVSGGVDSSVMAVVADQYTRDIAGRVSVVGAMATYPGLKCDETPYVQPLEEVLHFPVERWDGTQSVPFDLTSPALDGPGFRSAFVNGTVGDIEIAQRQNASVILSGTGGDELTVSVGTTKDMLARREWARAVKRVFFAPGSNAREVMFRLKHLSSQYLPTSIAKRQAIRRFRVPTWLTELSRQRVGDIVAGGTSLELESAASAEIWQRINSPQLICSVDSVQRQAAAHGIEYRFPFLDRAVVRFVVTAAAGYWPERTRPHQRAFEADLPDLIRHRRSKADLTPAFINRIRRAAPLIDRQFSGPWASARYVTREAAMEAWRAFDPQTADGGTCRRIWSVVTLEAWLRRVFGYIPSA